MNEPKTLKTNQYWGKRSGKITADGGVFQQGQWAAGASHQGKQKKVGLHNVNKKWFV